MLLTQHKQLVYIDEAHCSDLRTLRSLTPGMKNQPRRRVMTGFPAGFCCTITVATNMTDCVHPITWSMRQGSNNRWDFCNFVEGLISDGVVRQGEMSVLNKHTAHNSQRQRTPPNAQCMRETKNNLTNLMKAQRWLLTTRPSISHMICWPA